MTGITAEHRCTFRVQPRHHLRVLVEEPQRLIVESSETARDERCRRIRHDCPEEIARRHGSSKHRLAPNRRRQRQGNVIGRVTRLRIGGFQMGEEALEVRVLFMATRRGICVNETRQLRDTSRSIRDVDSKRLGESRQPARNRHILTDRRLRCRAKHRQRQNQRRERQRPHRYQAQSHVDTRAAHRSLASRPRN
jgi:hypothetical protein